MHQLDDTAGMSLRCECSGASEKKWNKDSLRLAEHVAQRKEIQNANRLKRTSPHFILRDLGLKRTKVGADVSMTMHHAFRLARRAGGVDDFNNVVRCDHDRFEAGGRRQVRNRVEKCIVDEERRL